MNDFLPFTGEILPYISGWQKC